MGGNTERPRERERDRPYIRNVDDLLQALGKRDISADNQLETGSTHSSSQQRRRFKKVSFISVINHLQWNLSSRCYIASFSFTLIATHSQTRKIWIPTHNSSHTCSERNEACIAFLPSPSSVWTKFEPNSNHKPSKSPQGASAQKLKLMMFQNLAWGNEICWPDSSS